MSVVVRAEAEKHGRDFRRTYRLGEEERILFRPSRERIDETMNTALLIVLDKLLKDEELLTFLAH